MATNYNANINLRDSGSIATLQKVIKATEDLKKHLEDIAKKKIEINVKTGSSFHNVENSINRLVSRPRTVRINATENVTRTISNVQRQMFEMTGRLNSRLTTSLNASGTAFGNSLRNSLMSVMPSVSQAIATNRALRAINGYNTAHTIASAGGAALGGGLLGGIVARNGRNIIANPNLNNNNDITRSTSGFLNSMRNGLDRMARKMPAIFGAVSDAMNTHSPFIPSGGATPIDSWFQNMISNQQSRIEDLNSRYTNLTGKTRSPYLPRYERTSIPLGPDDFEPILRNIGDPTIFERMSRSASSTANKIKAFFGSAASGIKNFFTSMPSFFSRIGTALTSKFPVAFNRIQTYGLRAFYFVERGAYKSIYAILKPITMLGSAFGKVKSLASSAFNGIKSIGSRVFGLLPQPLQNGMTRAWSKVKSLASSAASHMKSVFSSAASNISSGLKSAFSKAFSVIKGIATATIAAITAGFVTGTKHLAEQENNLVSMRHFIKNGDRDTNGGTNTLNTEQIAEKADKFMNNLTYLADSTPFDNADIYSAGRRAIQMTNGDTERASEITRQAADMAALNPGTTASDAMEALFDLKNGETERMKTFGMKITQDDLKMLVRGETGGDSLTSEESNLAFQKLTEKGGKVSQIFDGGASELSGTLGGRFSTLKGQFKQVLVEAVRPFEEMLKGAVENAISFLGVSMNEETGELQFDGISGAIIDSMKTVSSFVQDIANGDSSNFPIIDNLINGFEKLQEAVSPVVNKLSEQFGKIYDSCNDSFGGLGGIVEGSCDVIGKVIKGLTPILDLLSPCFDFIKETAIAVWPIVSDIIDGASTVIQDSVGFIKPVIEAATQVMGNIGDVIAQVWPQISDTISKCWDNLKPVFELFGDLAKGVADIFTFLWPGIADIISVLWNGIGWILEDITGALGDIAGAAKWAFDKLCEFGNWIDNKWEYCKKVGADIKDMWNNGGRAPEQGTEEYNQMVKNSKRPDGSNAFGISRVPRNGYISELHEGERVLTARENREYNDSITNNNNNAKVEIHIHESNNTENTLKSVYGALKQAHLVRA